MFTLKRTNAQDADFIALVKQLDTYLSIVDGEDHSFYDQYNQLDSIKYAIVVYKGERAVGCGAIKLFDEGRMEIKRMFVRSESRGKGIATLILNGLENWAKEMNCTSCVLETGKRQKEAVALYKKNKYSIIENYGQYKGMENSLCFEKALSA